jgi:hypothetical protein
MKGSALKALATALLLSMGAAHAQDVLIRNATVHTATAQGTLQNADVLVSNGVIRAVGKDLLATPDAQVIDAQGRPLTPTLFGGITEIGLEEVSGEKSTVDASVGLGAGSKQMTVRPEFDVTLAYNPDSVLLPVERIEGIGWTLLGANTTEGGSIIGGQGGVVRLDGSPDPIGPRVLFVNLGSEASGLTGNSRAAQWMLLDQLIDEVRGRIAPPTSASCCAGRRGTRCAWRSRAVRKRGSSRRSWPPPRCRCSSIRSPTCRRTSTRSTPRWRTPRACVPPAWR